MDGDPLSSFMFLWCASQGRRLSFLKTVAHVMCRIYVKSRVMFLTLKAAKFQCEVRFMRLAFSEFRQVNHRINSTSIMGTPVVLVS